MACSFVPSRHVTVQLGKLASFAITLEIVVLPVPRTKKEIELGQVTQNRGIAAERPYVRDSDAFNHESIVTVYCSASSKRGSPEQLWQQRVAQGGE
jgi:hypothetical protein